MTLKLLLRHFSLFQAKRLNFLCFDKVQQTFISFSSTSTSFNKNEFRQANYGNFFQVEPKLQNPFDGDIPLQRFLNLHVPKDVNKEIFADLSTFGSRIVNEIDELGWECEENPPRLITQDAWGNQIDRLITCNAWKRQHDISAEEGLIAIAYDRKLDIWSRLHQVCKLYLYSPSSGLYGCPLAMTDGAARTIELVNSNDKRFKKAFNHITSRNPQTFWTSGQWMTERRGGSDVASSTETYAIKDGSHYRLYGYKWFTSASDSNMALTLARISDASNISQEKGGLSLFYVETKTDEGLLNNLQIIRLKNKLGTRQLPTAEILLDGSIAHRIGEENRGIAAISHMLNITRMHNAIAAVSGMRRIIMLARDYSRKRMVFGDYLCKNVLHMRTLSEMEIETRGALLLLLKITILLGKSELRVASSDELLLLRLLSPVLKLYTAKQAVSVISEGLEAIGGQGYIEDTRLPVMFRDAQVLPIWEGTTNIMSLDVIRCLSKTNNEVLLAFKEHIMLCLEIGKKNSNLMELCIIVEKKMKCALEFIERSPELIVPAARDFAYSIARITIGALLIENASMSKKSTDIYAAKEWCLTKNLCPVSKYEIYKSMQDDIHVVMEGC